MSSRYDIYEFTCSHAFYMPVPIKQKWVECSWSISSNDWEIDDNNGLHGSFPGFFEITWDTDVLHSRHFQWNSPRPTNSSRNRFVLGSNVPL